MHKMYLCFIKLCKLQTNINIYIYIIFLGNNDLVVLQLISFLFASADIVLKSKTILRPSKKEQSNASIVKIPVNINN